MKFNSQVSAKSSIGILRRRFNNITDSRNKNKIEYALPDVLMSGVAMFSLKYPSLLQFDKDNKNKEIPHLNNLKSLYDIFNLPSDTQFRTILDDVDPGKIHTAFKDLTNHLQRSKVLEGFKFLNDSYLIAGDGTGHFSSKTVQCENCCIKNHKDGTQTFYHQAFSLVMVHNKIKQVIPMCCESIQNADGNTKNDCEFNAFKRSILKFKEEHPRMKAIITLDGLFGKEPIVALLKNSNLGYIIGVKPGDHHFLFDQFDNCDKRKNIEFEVITMVNGKKVKHIFSYMNDVSLNESNKETLVNFLKYTEIKNGKKTTWCWITDQKITKNNAWSVMIGGRTRWRIENETFNTLKNQGYNFEHNFGHGDNFLSNNLFLLMMLAFLIDQIQALACPVFKKLIKVAESYNRLWERMRAVFFIVDIVSWKEFYQKIGNAFGLTHLFNSS